ncbi:ferritin, partial [Vibrio parahaemolyticus]|nr:ferritin [Vibrio parahaemolyticus]
MLVDVFSETYEHEQMITEKNNKLAHDALTSPDNTTYNFQQRYVSEHHEQEKTIKAILDTLA